MSDRLDMAPIFGNLRPRSRMSVKLALETAQLDGVAATLVIQIPSAADRPSEIFFTNAPSGLVSELWRVDQF